MTHLVLRSNVPDENSFSERVAMHALNLRSYAIHIEAVNRKEAQYYPPPFDTVDVDASVRRPDFVPDYEIVDRFPIQHGDIQSFEQRRNELRQQVASMENAAINLILPRGKWRLKEMEYQNASVKPPNERTSDDVAVVTEHEGRNIKVRAINLYHAQLESEIEDLNFDTINGWSPTPFKG